jgi:alginate O-acetyltransferase complex protein AlgJ
MLRKLKCPTQEQLPLVLIFLILFLPLTLSLLYLLGDKGRKVLKMVEGKPLVGVQNTVSIEVTTANWLSGNLHREAEVWLNQKMPLRSIAVKATNQIYYSLFSKSYMSQGTIVVGKDEHIYVNNFIGKYCTNIAWNKIIYQKKLANDIHEWSEEVKEVADFFKRRGQIFIYLITPSKAAYYPEYIPAQFYCNPASPRSDEDLAMAALDKRGIPYIDTSQVILNAKGGHLIDLFSQGGLHWNDLGASLASREILAQASKITGKPLPKLEFSYTIHRNPLGDDLDLLNLLNLWNPNHDFPVPKVTIKKNKQTRLKLAIVGGSFINSVSKMISQSNTFCRIDYYYYFSLGYFPSPIQEQGSCDTPDHPNSYQNLLGADIVILEENSENIQSKHLQLLRQFTLKK